MNPSYLWTAIGSAIDAGRRIREIYRTDFSVSSKTDQSPLTLADTESHALIRQALAPLGLPILSEEGRAIPYEVRKTWTRFWLVDPLDGTKEFIKKNGEFTVNIALIDQARPVMGVIFVPVTGALYFSFPNRGAYVFTVPEAGLSEGMDLSDLVAASRSLPLEDDREDGDAYVIVGSRSHATEALTAFVEQKKNEHPRVTFISAGSSLKLCLVAEGRADIYPRLGPTMEWDTAAGQAIAEAAGRRVSCSETGRALVYNKPDLLNPWFIVE
ncbi:3'(2'),5'-bisphosphate nucleotidase CysQ [Desulfatiferula olefinivorans]